MPQIKLLSSDNVKFVVDVEVAKVSKIIKSMLEDGLIKEDHGNVEDVVPLNNIKSEILEKVIKWATYHKDDPPPPEEKEFDPPKKDISPWDVEFLRVDWCTLLELVTAANYLDIKELMDLTCKAVAIIIKDKSVEEIRKMFNIENDIENAAESIIEDKSPEEVQMEN